MLRTQYIYISVLISRYNRSPFRRPVMWQLGLMYGLSIGSVFTWGSVLDILVNSLGISQVSS